jgi:hypothetical protein
MPNAFTIASWVMPHWTDPRDRIIATTVGLVHAGDLGKASGVFGKGGTVGDGPSQAAAAYAAWRSGGWEAFPERTSGAAALYWPIAAAAVAEQTVQKGAGAAADKVGAAGDAASSVASSVSDIATVANWITTPNASVRIVKVVIGAGLIAIGSLMLSLSVIGTPFTNLLNRKGDEVATYGQVAGKGF